MRVRVLPDASRLRCQTTARVTWGAPFWLDPHSAHNARWSPVMAVDRGCSEGSFKSTRFYCGNLLAQGGLFVSR